jgi:hypothetical protein
MSQSETIREILWGFVHDPPDTDYQRGFLAAALTIANEVMGISVNDEIWKRANRILCPEPMVEEAERMLARKKRAKLTVIDGDKP